MLVKQNMDWETASCYCQAKGHSLASIRSAEEQQRLASYLRKLEGQ